MVLWHRLGAQRSLPVPGIRCKGRKWNIHIVPQLSWLIGWPRADFAAYSRFISVISRRRLPISSPVPSLPIPLTDRRASPAIPHSQTARLMPAKRHGAYVLSTLKVSRSTAPGSTASSRSIIKIASIRKTARNELPKSRVARMLFCSTCSPLPPRRLGMVSSKSTRC